MNNGRLFAFAIALILVAGIPQIALGSEDDYQNTHLKNRTFDRPSSHKGIALHEGSSARAASPPSYTTEAITVDVDQVFVDRDEPESESPHDPFYLPNIQTIEEISLPEKVEPFQNTEIHEEPETKEPLQDQDVEIEKLWELGTGSDYSAMKTVDSSYFGSPLLIFGNRQGYVHAVANSNGDFSHLWRSTDLGNWLIDIEVGDVDADEQLEIVVAHQYKFFILDFDLDGAAIIWESESFGKQTGSNDPFERRIVDISLGDTDGDGKLEICLILIAPRNYGVESFSFIMSDVYVYENQGDSWAVEWRNVPPDSLIDGYYSLAVGDILGGAEEEIILGGATGVEILSHQNGIYTKTWMSPPLGDDVRSLALGDIDGDGLDDLIAFTGNKRLAAFKNMNRMTMTVVAQIECEDYGRITVSELTGDDKEEIVLAGNKIFIYQYENYALQLYIEEWVSGYPMKVDESNLITGVREIIVCCSQNAKFFVLTIEKDELLTIWESDFISVIMDMEIGDFYGTGQNMIAVTDDRNCAYIVSLSGERKEKLTFNYTYPSTIMTSGDYNLDGKDELAFATFDSGWNHNFVHIEIKGSVQGSLQTVKEHWVYSEFEPAFMETGDIDEDGYPEIVLATNGDTYYPYWGVTIDDGDVIVIDWFDAEKTNIRGYSEGLAIADTDGDGDLEIVHKGYMTYMSPGGWGWTESYHNRIYIAGYSNGEYKMEAKIENYPYRWPDSAEVFVADFNNDGAAGILDNHQPDWCDLYHFNGTGYEEIDGGVLEDTSFATTFDFEMDGVLETVATNSNAVYIFDLSAGYNEQGREVGEIFGGTAECLHNDGDVLLFHLENDGYLSAYNLVL